MAMSWGFHGCLVQTILKLVVGLIFEHLKEDIILIRKQKTNHGHIHIHTKIHDRVPLSYQNSLFPA